MLRNAGFDADTVWDEQLGDRDDTTICERARSESRVLVTLDLDFANIRAYPPGAHSGLIVLRLRRQDKFSILAVIRRLTFALNHRDPAGELWIVEEDRIRFRDGR